MVCQIGYSKKNMIVSKQKGGTFDSARIATSLDIYFITLHTDIAFRRGVMGMWRLGACTKGE